MLKRFLWVLLPAALTGCVLFTPYADTEAVLRSRMDASGVPGLSAATVSTAGIESTYYLGYQDTEKEIPVTGETLFCIGSVSKTITGAVVMKAREEGLIDLDQDINTYLPFPVRHPRYPDVPITIRMLLTHSSGIITNYDLIINNRNLWHPVNPSENTLEDLNILKDYLTPDSRYYSEKNFSPYKPGTETIYSNEGIALAALIVEITSGEPFEDYSTSRILAPLGISGSWDYSQVDQSRLALSYDLNGNLMDFLHLYVWPAGSYITNAQNLAKFVQMILNEGTVHGTEILSADSVRMMTTPQLMEYGLTWAITNRPIAGRETIGHTGTLPGQRAFAYLDMNKKEGVILLTNSDWVLTYATQDMLTALFMETDQLP